MSEIKHSPLPFHACQYENGTIYSAERLLVAKNVIFGRNMGLNDVEFIVEACNNYYKLKEQNEKLKAALQSISLSMSVHYDCSDGSEFIDMINIANKVLKSCES